MRRRVRAVIIEDGKVLTIRRHRPDKDKHFWVFPGGGREEDEADVQALVREVSEELGIAIEIESWYATELFKGPEDKEAQEEVFYLCHIRQRSGEIRYIDAPKNGTYDPEWLEISRIKPDMLLEPLAIRDRLIGE